MTKITVPSSESTSAHLHAHASLVERRLGDTEVSYFLPSRESGVNDMYLHLGYNAPASLLQPSRVSRVWAILRLRHPLLASKVEMHDYEDVRFVWTIPSSPDDALVDASKSLEYRTQTKDELIDSYLNGPRTLSNDRLSYLVVSQINAEDDASIVREYDFLICATHFLGDGMALHQFANDFFGLLGGSKSEDELHHILTEEHSKIKADAPTLPLALEDRLPSIQGKFHRAACRIDFDKNEEKLIGGHAFPRRSGAPRKTVVPTVAISMERTGVMLKKCKAHGVSISAALFAVCNIAWAKTHNQNWEMPTMMYSALNLRPNLTAHKSLNDSYWFIAIGYFNIILPTFLPPAEQENATFWHRARLAKEQSTRAAKSPMIVSRSREKAKMRGNQARVWAKEDDDRDRGTLPAPPASDTKISNKAPSKALLGLSLLGNLDGIYKHAMFPDIKLHTLTTGSRQRSGGMLLFGYTFVGKLWVSLGYDENGFENDTVKLFWDNVLNTIERFLG